MAVIQHEKIPGYMDAMTMPFKAREPRVLDGLQAGDEVRFRLLVTEDESWIEDVRKIGHRQIEQPAPGPQVTNSPAEKPRHPLLDYAFTNQLGKPVRLSDYKGQALAITFFFTRCPIPDYCPRLSKNFQEASQTLAGMPNAPTNYHFLSVSFDTAFDTPEVLKAYAERYHYDPAHWSFITGPQDKITELARLSDVTFNKDGSGFFDHGFRTQIIDAKGRLQMSFPIGGNLSDAIVSELVKAAAPKER
ncbi:MAG: electron transport protein SCO1/SenC [Verrucomicrobiales bacterium]|nr:electron transport protein SCO1/SenC [Verrucomicrobiales bacterium]